MLPHEELLAHLQKLRASDSTDDAYEEHTAKTRPFVPHCFTCGQFKSRPSSVCTKCGDDPVSMTNAEYYDNPAGQELARSNFDSEHGWWPPSMDEEAKSYGREPRDRDNWNFMPNPIDQVDMSNLAF